MKKKLIILCASLLFTAVLLEAGLRVLGFSSGIYRTDPGTGLLTLKPDSEFYWTKECFKNMVKTNTTGFNDEEFKTEKDDGVYRIVILGDSYVEGLQVPQEKTFHRLLEKKLNETFSDRKFEVYAIGKSGNGSYANYLYLKNYGLKYHPDLIIDAFLVGNDFRDDDLDLAKIYAQQTGDNAVFNYKYPQLNEQGELMDEPAFNQAESKQNSKLRAILSRSSLLTFLYTKFKLLKAKNISQQIGVGAPGQTEVDTQVFLTDYSTNWQNIWKKEEAILKKIQETSMNTGSKFALVSLTEAYRTHFPDQQQEGYDYSKPERLLGELAERNSMPYLALLPKFQERYKKDQIKTTFDCDGHWTEVGHSYAAEDIMEFLKNRPELLNVQQSDIMPKP